MITLSERTVGRRLIPGTKPFENLHLLSSPETIQLWTDFLRSSLKLGRLEQSGNQKLQPRRTVKSELERIKSENPEKYQALTRFGIIDSYLKPFCQT